MIAHISSDGLNREESVAEHTAKVTYLCNEKGKRCGLSQVMSLCGIFHDMGKNKQKFNDYIHAEEKIKYKIKGSIAHASTGAKYIYDMCHGGSGKNSVMAEMISYAVAAHHGIFDCVNIEHIDEFTKRLTRIEDYEEACANARRNYLDKYELDKILASAVEEFQLVWDKCKSSYERVKPLLLDKYGKDAKEMLSDYKFFLLACLQRLILSMLIDSDWEATSDFMDNVDTMSKKSLWDTKEIYVEAKDKFEQYMRRKKQTVSILTNKEEIIFKARNSLQEECRNFAKFPAGIYCLPIPTGGGKTLDSLAYALEYCRCHPETERIVYVSPYISITEQNAQVFREAVGNERWILEHHSSVLRSEVSNSEDYRADKFSRYDINWEEPFICTTFIQFMNTLFEDKSVSIRRMHRLVNAVVIIDEIQSMPLKCIHTFNYMINFLNTICNTNIILCTATQPTLEETQCPICYSQPKNMIENVTEWFHKFERVKISTPKLGEKYTFESLGNEIVECATDYRSILVVLNTKSAVRKLYDILKEKDIYVEYLTTNLCAAHRSDRIKAIKAVLENRKERIVVISSNLIEAGVDISFECVYRSMTGLDSLAQTAGRCNRNGEMKCGMIHLIRLEDENIGNMIELQQNMRVTESVIAQYSQNEGKNGLLMPEWMDYYYKEVYSMALDKMNFPIEKLDTNIIELLSEGFGTKEKKNYMNQAYKTAGQEYRVISDNTFGVIVPYERGANIIEAIQEAVNEVDLKAIVRQAQRYTVNVRESQLKKFEGLIQSVSDKIPELYMVAAPGIYNNEYGIEAKWETLIF